MKITNCLHCGGRVRAETIGWMCEKCGGFISVDGVFHPHQDRSFMPPRTNADRIRAMSDEELAMFQAERSAADSFLRIKDEGNEVTAAQRAALVNRLYRTWMAYLKQTAEEAENDRP